MPADSGDRRKFTNRQCIKVRRTQKSSSYFFVPITQTRRYDFEARLPCGLVTLSPPSIEMSCCLNRDLNSAITGLFHCEYHTWEWKERSIF